MLHPGFPPTRSARRSLGDRLVAEGWRGPGDGVRRSWWGRRILPTLTRSSQWGRVRQATGPVIGPPTHSSEPRTPAPEPTSGRVASRSSPFSSTTEPRAFGTQVRIPQSNDLKDTRRSAGAKGVRWTESTGIEPNRLSAAALLVIWWGSTGDGRPGQDRGKHPSNVID
jgi:hypothetical protein